MENNMSILEDAIKKYSGGDDAYALKLKSHIREGMGYSNYMSRIGAETAGPAALGDIKGLSPAGIKSRIASRFGDQEQNINSLRGMAGAMDTAAGSLAAEQIAREKAAASSRGGAEGFKNGVTFSPQNQIQTDILSYMQNPKNPDGSVKSLQQFEAELVDKYGASDQITKNNVGPDGTLIPRDILNADQIKSEIQNKLPKDFIGNEDKYHFMAQGYSQKQADELQGGLRYDTMSEPEKLIYQVTNPQMAKALEEGGVNKDLLSDIGIKTTETGETVPKYSFDELKEKYPNVPEATLKPLVIPMERKSLQDDVQKWFNGGIKEAAIDMIQNPKEGYSVFMTDPKYKEFKTKLSMEYGSVFADKDIDQLIYNTIMSQ